MINVDASDLVAFVNACHQLEEEGLVRCSSGNLSHRLPDDRFMISMTRRWLGHITNKEVAILNLSDGAHLNDVAPSSEWRIHQGILQERSDISVVLHFHSPFATTMACRKTSHVNFNVIPEIPYYIGPVERVPYQLPGSEELANSVVSCMKEHNLVVLENHDEVTVGRTFQEALQRAVFFEFACQIIIVGGEHITPLSDDAVETLTML